MIRALFRRRGFTSMRRIPPGGEAPSFSRAYGQQYYFIIYFRTAHMIESRRSLRTGIYAIQVRYLLMRATTILQATSLISDVGTIP